MNELSEQAQEEIERTAQEAVKQAVAETGGELAYEKSLRESWQNRAGELELLNEKITEELEQERTGGKRKTIVLTVETGILAGTVTALLLTLSGR